MKTNLFHLFYRDPIIPIQGVLYIRTIKAFLNNEFRNKYLKSITKHSALFYLRGYFIQLATVMSCACMYDASSPDDAGRCARIECRPSFRQGSKTAAQATVIEPLIAKVA